MVINVETDTTSTARKIAESIAALPPLPSTAQKILTCFGDEFIDAEKVGNVVEGDPGICARLLGLANSAYFGLSEPVTSIHEAISRVLGVDTVRSLVLAMAIQRSFNSKSCPTFAADRFWIQSLLTADCSKKIAAADELASDAVRDLAYSTGLCHNLGLMALAHMEPDRTRAILQAHCENPQLCSLASRFLDDLNTDHKIVTSELSRLWNLPEPMVSAYHYRAYTDSASDDRLGLIISTAAAAVGNAEADENDQTDISQWARDLGVGADDLQQMAVFGERQRDKILSLSQNMSG